MTEFSRQVRIDTLGGAPRDETIAAGAGERAALAERFAILAIDRLEARAELTRSGTEIRANGALCAGIVQACAATGAALSAAIDAPFAILFRPEGPIDAPEAGLELSESECDVVFYRGGAVDLGEAVAETLALAIDPYPRAPDADAVLKAAGIGESAPGPFAALAVLKKDGP